jgi:protein TonB
LTASPHNHTERAHTALPKRRVAAGRHLIALTRDPALAQTLQELAGGDLSIHLVEDLAGLADALMQHATAVALLDAKALGVPVDAAVDAVKRQFPDLRLMVAGYVAEQTLLASRIADQKVFRFVQKPASTLRLKVFLEAATLQRPERRATDRFPATEAIAGAGATRPPGGFAELLPLLAGGLAVAIIAVGAWLLLRDKEDDVAVEQAVAEAQGTAVVPGVAAVLASADAALVAGNLIAADGSSAAELYREALQLDAGSTAAAEGFERAIEAALAGAEQALLAGEPGRSRETAELLRLVVPDSTRLAFLYTQIERELARMQAAATQRQSPELQRREQVRAEVAAEDQRNANGVVSGLVDTGELDAVRTAAVAAPEPVRAPEPLPLPVPVQSSTQPAEPISIPTPESAPVATRAPDGTGVVSSARLQTVRRIEPEFPLAAAQQQISGWVELEFTVTTDGNVKDAVVTASEPRRTFDSAALTAMRRYRYAPVLRDGQPVEQRARLRMRFNAED